MRRMLQARVDGHRVSSEAGVVLALALLTMMIPAVSAQPLGDPAYSAVSVHSPRPEANGRWAERTATAGDINGDGINDVWVGVPKADGGAGRVYLASGAALGRGQTEIIHEIASPEPQSGALFGFFISNPGDLNGDGTPDLAAGSDLQNVDAETGSSCNADGAPEPDGCNEGQGKAWAFDGKTGTVLYAMNNPVPQGGPGNVARFGSRIGRAGDVNGDGVPELIVGASNNDVCATPSCDQALQAAQQTPGTQAAAGNLACGDVSNPIPEGCRRDEGQAFIFNGRDGSLVRTLSLPAEDRIPETCSDRPADLPPQVLISGCGGFGASVQGPGDTNGDGVTDQLVGAQSLKVGGNDRQGRLYVFSGKDGSLLLKIDDPAPQAGAGFGFQDVSPLSPGDVNRDGYADVYGNGFTQGRAWVFNGKTGTVLYEVVNPNPTLGSQFGWSMSREQTYYGKGKAGPHGPLYVGAAPHHPFAPPCDSDPRDGQVDEGKVPGVNCQDQRGETNLINARNGSPIDTLSLPAPWNNEFGSGFADLGPNLGWTVSTPGDLNRDGEPDYVAGAPFTNVGSTPNQGVLIVFLSSRDGRPVGAQCKPGWGRGDTNQCHSGPPGLRGHPGQKGQAGE